MYLYMQGVSNLVLDFNALEMPTSIYLKLTNDCLFHCPFCSVGLRRAEYMDFIFIQKILNFCKKEGVQTVYYTGGEPLMHSQINEIVQFGRRLGLKQVLLTNGFLLETNKLDLVLKNVDVLGVSLHGTPKVHDALVGINGASKKILASLSEVHKKYPNLRIGINCTLSRNNGTLKELEYLAKVAQSYNGSLEVSRLNFAGKARVDFKIEELNTVAKVIQSLQLHNFHVSFGNCIAHCLLDKPLSHLGRGCSAGVSSACIDVNGDIKICPSASFVIGNLKNESFKRIWNTKKMRDFRSFSWVPSSCTVCNFFLKCRSGCKIEIVESFSKNICDKFVEKRFSNIWNEMCNKKYIFSGSFIRKDFSHYTIISPHVIRKCNKDVLLFIKSITGDKTCEEILHMVKNKEECKNLLISLKIDMLLKEIK